MRTTAIRAITCALVGAGTVATLIPTSSQAQRVYTFAETRSYAGQAIYSAYNGFTDFIGGPQLGDFGFRDGDGCNGLGTSSCSGTKSTSPVISAPTAFAATSMSMLSDVIYNPASGSASARASLYTGEIGASAQGAFRGCPGYTCWIQSEAIAQVGEGLHFTVAGADATTHTTIGITFDVDGVMGVAPDGSNPFAQGLLHVFENGNVSAEFLTQILVGTASSGASGAWLSYTISPNTAGHVSFTGLYDLVGATHDLGIGYSLVARSGTSYSDYYSTGKIGFDLPSNVSFTSNSGVFLSANGAVPEPATWAVLTLGFGAIGVALRRRRPAAVVA